MSVAIGPADRVAAYLSGAAYTTVTSTGSGDLAAHYGTAVPTPPRVAGIWTAQAAGTGMVTLRWTAETGDWVVVAMNPDGSPGLTVRAEAGVLAPWLFQLAVELIVGGIAAGAAVGGADHRAGSAGLRGTVIVMAWLMVVAGLFETGFAVLLKQSHGITRPKAGRHSDGS